MSMKEATEKVTDQFLPFLARMQDGPAKDYIKYRLFDQMQWYEKESAEKQRRFKALSLAAIVINAVIPVVTLLSEYGVAVRIGIAAFSAAAGVIGTVVNLCRYQDLWVQYRAGCEYLKGILYRYFMRIGEFSSDAEDPAQCDRSSNPSARTIFPTKMEHGTPLPPKATKKPTATPRCRS